ncbi:MAG: hypothetical protein U0992_17720 [Planctomycetaceae bacterium]
MASLMLVSVIGELILLPALLSLRAASRGVVAPETTSQTEPVATPTGRRVEVSPRGIVPARTCRRRDGQRTASAGDLTIGP